MNRAAWLLLACLLQTLTAHAQPAPTQGIEIETTPPQRAFPPAEPGRSEGVPGSSPPVGTTAEPTPAPPPHQGESLGIGERGAGAEAPEPISTAPTRAAQGSAPVKTDWGAVLREAAPAIAKVGCEDSWYTGFLIRPDLVVTALYTVLGHCTPEVRFRDGEPIATKVVAWSNTDRVVILQLEKPVSAKPLHLGEPRSTLEVGDEVVVLTADEDDSEERRTWRSPRLRWARVSSLEPTVLDHNPAWISSGAPVLSPAGEVIGVFVGTPPGAVPIVVPSSALDGMVASVGRQGDFSRPWSVGICGGVMFSGRLTDGQSGLLIPLGVTFDWLALQAALGVWSTAREVAQGNRLEQKSLSGVEFEANARYVLPGKTYALAGLGVQFAQQTRRTWPIGDGGAEEVVNEGRNLTFLSLAAGTQLLQLRVVTGLSKPEVRLELGLLMGRY